MLVVSKNSTRVEIRIVLSSIGVLFISEHWESRRIKSASAIKSFFVMVSLSLEVSEDCLKEMFKAHAGARWSNPISEESVS